jgi:hypothetical protein
MTKFRRSLPWALVALAFVYAGSWAIAFASDAAPEIAATATEAPISTADIGEVTLDLSKLFEDIKKGNAPGIISFIIIGLTLLLSGKLPLVGERAKKWLADPKNEWAKPTITIILGILGVAMPQLLAGVGLGKALLFGFMSSGGAALAFKLGKTFWNSWQAKKGIVVVNIPAKEADAIVKMTDQPAREKAWADLVTKLSGGTAAPETPAPPATPPTQ